MTTRTPDFWVVKRDGIDGVTEYLTHEDPEVYWSYDITVRTRFVTRAEAERSIRNNPYKGPSISIVPVYCTTRKTNTMRERSSAWVLRRLAEGKVVMVQLVHNGAIFFQRFNAKNGFIEHAIHNTSCWKLDNAGFAVNGRVLCRVARSEEVEK